MEESLGISDAVTYQLIGLAMKTHTELGPGLDEICYHESMSARMASASIEHTFKPRFDLRHRGLVADQFEADLIVPGSVVIEAKHLRGTLASEHYAQLHCYLKAWKIQTGLLLDFGKQTLIVRRRKAPPTPCAWPDAVEFVRILTDGGLNEAQARSIASCLRRILQEHGLGYWEKTYRGLVEADLRAENIDFVQHPEISVETGPGRHRHTRLGCLVIEGRLALQVLALHDSISAAAQAVLRSYLRHLGLQVGVSVNFGKRRIDLITVHRQSR